MILEMYINDVNNERIIFNSRKMLFEHFASAEAKGKTLCGWCGK